MEMYPIVYVLVQIPQGVLDLKVHCHYRFKVLCVIFLWEISDSLDGGV